MTATSAPTRPPAPVDPMLPRLFRVRQVRADTADTFTVVLAPEAGAPLDHRPGQFTMLQVFGVGEVPISISGPAGAGWLEQTVRDVGAVTHALVHLAPGDQVGVRGPFGTAWGAEEGAGGDVVFVAGGIGLAPLRPAILQVLARRDRYRRVVLLHGARTPQDILFGDQLLGWAQRYDVTVETIVDNGRPGWAGPVGLVTDLIPRAGFDPTTTLALVCGPEVMMDHTARALLARGVPATRVRLSMERSMKCGIGLCGHCQLRELFLCVDGPVLGYDVLAPLLATREL